MLFTIVKVAMSVNLYDTSDKDTDKRLGQDTTPTLLGERFIDSSGEFE